MHANHRRRIADCGIHREDARHGTCRALGPRRAPLRAFLHAPASRCRAAGRPRRALSARSALHMLVVTAITLISLGGTLSRLLSRHTAMTDEIMALLFIQAPCGSESATQATVSLRQSPHPNRKALANHCYSYTTTKFEINFTPAMFGKAPHEMYPHADKSRAALFSGEEKRFAYILQAEPFAPSRCRAIHIRPIEAIPSSLFPAENAGRNAKNSIHLCAASNESSG